MPPQHLLSLIELGYLFAVLAVVIVLYQSALILPLGIVFEARFNIELMV